MTTEQRFSLETLSKIPGATYSDDVEQFFAVLDQHISDEDLANHKPTQKPQSVKSFREDKEISSPIQTEIILNNFPQKHETALQVPQIL